MLNTSQKKVLDAINQLGEDKDIIEVVKKIEGGIATTKGNYGKYMQLIQPWHNESKMHGFIISQALIKAGANRYGVEWALNLLNGGY